MRGEDAFVLSILDHPDDDTHRLVFADWLDDHGRASHAELIRVQCELARLPKRSRDPNVKARRATLAAREKALLRLPEFFPKWPAGVPTPQYDSFKNVTGSTPVRYERGFIPRLRLMDGEMMAPEWAVSPWRTLLDEGKALAIDLSGDQGGFQTGLLFDPYEMADLAGNPSLLRVTRLDLFEGRLTADNLGVLAQSPLLTQLREIWFGDCTISPKVLRTLVTSPVITQLRHLFMAPAYLERGGRERGVGPLWEVVAAAPHMASLDRLWIDSLDNRAAEALLASPHLKPSLRIWPDPSGEMGEGWEREALRGSLSAANVRALRARYPGTPF